jgi:molybdopterin converting factor small subunit
MERRAAEEARAAGLETELAPASRVDVIAAVSGG